MAENNSKIQFSSLVDCLSPDFDTSQIIKTNLDLSSVLSSDRLEDPLVAFTLDHVFTPEESQSLIDFSEARGFTKVPVNIGPIEVINESYRSGFRVIADDTEFVSRLWARIESFVPKKFNGAKVLGPNERLRFLKYNSGHFFAPHSDAHYVRPEDDLEISLLTIQMYLNEDFGGGETTFLEEEYEGHNRVPLKPRTGMLLIFDQDLRHEGSTVTSGTKYTVRTDIMYKYRE